MSVDLRSWLSTVESFGELRHVKGAHWDVELGAIAELSYRTAAPKALLFEGIEGYETGRVLTGSTGSARRLGHTLNLGDDLDDAALVAALRGKPSLWAATARDCPVETVTESPLLANVVDGADVDLLSLPVPRWHEHDAGRYVGTGCIVITRDPETGVINGGCYRMEVVDDGRTATINAAPIVLPCATWPASALSRSQSNRANQGPWPPPRWASASCGRTSACISTA